MTLNSTTTKISYSGDDATVEFDVPFKFLQNSHVVAVLRDAAGVETTWTEGSQYNLTGAGEENGGTLTVSISPSDFTPASGETLLIKRAVPETQGTALPLGGAFSSITVEQMVDLLTMQVQAHSEEIARAITVSAADPIASVVLPSLANRASKILAFDAAGELTTITNFGKWRGPWAASTAYVLGDVVQRAATKDLYIAVATGFTSGSDEATDITDTTRWALAMQQPTVNFFSDSFTGNGSQAEFTLENEPVSAAAAAVYVDGVRQEPVEDYTVSGTTLTFASAPGNGIEILAIYGNAGAADVADLAVTTAKIADDAVTLEKLATLTADRLVGTDSSGNPAEIAAGNGLTLSGSQLSVDQASQPEAEAESNVDKYVPPDLIKHSPGVAKFWCIFDGTSVGPITPDVDYNVVDVTDQGAGSYSVNIDTSFSDTNWMPGGNTGPLLGQTGIFLISSKSAGTLQIALRRRSDNVLSDSTQVTAFGFGDQQ